MAKKKEKKVVNIDAVNIDIDYDKLAEALVKAQSKYDNELILREEKIQQEHRENRNAVLGRKDYSGEKRWFVRKVKEVWSKVQLVFRVLFISKKDAQYLSGLNLLFQGITETIFALVRYGLYLVSATLIFLFIWDEHNPTYIIYTIAAFLYAQIFRLVQFEIERITDREYVLAIFAAIVSVISLVVSIVLR